SGRQSTFQVGERLTIRFQCNIQHLVKGQFYQLRISSGRGVPIYHWVDFDDDFSTVQTAGLDEVRVTLEKIPLYPGQYYVSLWVGDRYGTQFDYHENLLNFEVTSGALVPLRRRYYPQYGLIHHVPAWVRISGN